MVRAAVMPEPMVPVEIREFAEPTLQDNAVLLETVFSEVCGTDVHLRHGRLAGVPYPIIPGHVSVGRVEAVNGEVRDIDGNDVRPGSLVTFLDVHGTCHRCWYCLVAKETTKCPERHVYGITHSATEGLLGGWSERIYLQPDVHILTLPDGLDPRTVIAAGCALPTALHAIERAEISIGDRVVVQGAGPVGINAAILARLSGAGEVFIVDPVETRLEGARRLGVSAGVRIDPEDPGRHIRAIREMTGQRGADVTIEAAGVPQAFKEGIAMTRDGGRYVVVGHYTDTGSASVNPHTDINKKHLEIRGTWGSDLSHFYRMLDVLKRHGNDVGNGLGWDEMIGGVYSLGEVNMALDDVENGRLIKAIICPNGDRPSIVG